MSRLRRIVPLLACVLALGCGGGGGSEEDAVRDTLKAFAQAGADGDGEKACGLLSSAARAAVTFGEAPCEEVFSRPDEDFRAEARKQVDAADDLEVTIDGDDATAVYEGTELKLIRQDGEWRILLGS